MVSKPGWIFRRLGAWADRIMARRGADVVIRDPYLRRWHLIPRNPVMNVYLHWFGAHDPGPDLHDHPWLSLSLLLRGVLLEEMSRGKRTVHVAGDVVFRGAWRPHRLYLMSPYALTLFITGPRIRQWFQT